jgi:protoporphyrinogen oxidase
MSRVAIIGAGAMGLAAAYHTLKAGHRVTVLEADKVPGGMAAHFDFGGLSIERFYHFVCKADRPTFDLMNELGIGDRMRWVDTSMGYYVDGRLYDWGNPVALLRFPKLSMVEKLRYGLMMFLSVRRRSPGSLEDLSAKQWIETWCGERVYDCLWEPLFRLKFYDLADNISAAWIWTRIKRVGTSRRSLMQEELGYIDGGTKVLVDALVAAIKASGGDIRLAAEVEKVTIASGRVTGVVVKGGAEAFDAVVSTIPMPLVSRMVSDLPEGSKARYDAIKNIGVVCLIFKLKASVTPHFWVNIADERIAIPGIVEFSNLRPTKETIVYVPYYMPLTNPKWALSDTQLLKEAFGYLKLINPRLADSDLIDSKVGRLRFAQPVCPPGFGTTVPSVQTPVSGLQVADTCSYYPEDRGISESLRYGQMMAAAIDNPLLWGRSSNAKRVSSLFVDQRYRGRR